jgi:DNA-binding response OmpR family regulator
MKMPAKSSHQSIYRLRHKIERDPRQPQHLLNRSGQGYLLVNSGRA